MPFLKDKRKLQYNMKRLEEASKKNGLKCAVFSVSGDKYTGEWKDNNKEGKGAFLSIPGKLYEGDWVNDLKHGFGTFARRQENKVFILQYRGQWEQGLKSGFGARHYCDGSYYLGHFKDGKRHGQGQMWYGSGGFYDGSWFKDKRHGVGMWVRPDGNRYEGSWMNHLRNGKGRFFHLDSGQMQEGVWQDNICVCSSIVDIPFRQSTLDPTPYPIKFVEVFNHNRVLKEQESKVLQHKTSCLDFGSLVI